MGRGKLAMELIPSEKKREKTFHKRKKGLIKKAQEFTTLCDLKMCMIIYGPQLAAAGAGPAPPPQPEIWPVDLTEVRLIIDEFNNKKPRGTKGYGLPDFFARRLKTARDATTNRVKANYAAKFSPRWDDRLNDFSLTGIQAESGKVDSILDNARKRTMALKKMNNQRLVPAPDHHHHHRIRSRLNLTDQFDHVNAQNQGHSMVGISNPITTSLINHNEELIMSQQQQQHVLDHSYNYNYNIPPQISLDYFNNPSMMMGMNGFNFSTPAAAYTPFSALSAGYHDHVPIYPSMAAGSETLALPAPGDYCGPSMEPVKLDQRFSITSELHVSQLDDCDCHGMNDYYHEPAENKRQRFFN